MPDMDDMDEAGVRQILDVALRLGQLLLSCQAGTADVASTIVAITTAYGLPATHVDITANSITVSIPRAVPGAPITAVYVVESQALDYARLESASDLAQHVVDTTPELEWVQGQLDTVETAEPLYPGWVCTAGLGVMAGGFSLLFGAGTLIVVIATVTTALIDRVGRILSGWRIPSLFQQVAGATLATCVALGLEAAGRLPAATAPSVVVAASIVALLSGLASVGSVQDAIAGYQLTAVSRMMDITLSSAGILIGITIAVRIGEAIGADLHVSPDVPVAPLDLPVRVLAGAVGAGGAALASYAPLRAALAAGVAGATGSLIYFGMQFIGSGPLVGSFVAAVAIGLAGSVAARRALIPPLVIVTAGIIPLVPGMALFRSFAELIKGEPAAGAGSLVMAIGTALALGAGVLLGPLLAPSFQREIACERPHVQEGSRQRMVGRRLMPHLAGIRYGGRRSTGVPSRG